MISKTCQYALRAIFYIASNESSKFIPVKEIAEKNDISYFFLGKIMNALTRKGLVESYKGPNGGVKLSKSSKDITLFDVVEAIDGTTFMTECFLGSECKDKNRCPVHDFWKKIREGYLNMLLKKTINQIIKEIKNK